MPISPSSTWKFRGFLFVNNNMEGIYTLNDFSINKLYESMINSPYNNTEEFYNMNIFSKRKIIKEKYEKILPIIIKSKHKYINPYIVNWEKIMNENEFNLFQCFRVNNIPMYPQYPVLNYWLDFANPYFKVGIEADSNTYHKIENDIIRDIELKKLGWTIYHIPSSLSFCNISIDTSLLSKEENENEYYEQWYLYLNNTTEGVLNCIAKQITGYHYFIPYEFNSICKRISELYKLI